MERSVIFAGFGGQGLLFCGEVLAEAALQEQREVSWLPSYGPEMRGGTAYCTVILADRLIGSPLVDTPDAVLAMNPPSLARFEPAVAPGGLLVVNASLIEAQPTRTDIEMLLVPASQLASEAGDVRLATVVALGGLIACRPWVDTESIRRALAKLLVGRGDSILTADLSAFAAGLECGRSVEAVALEV